MSDEDPSAELERSALPDSLDGLAEVAVAEHEAFERDAHSAVAHAIRAGEALIAAKAKVRHGDWLPWLADHFPASETTAQRYMRLAANPARVTDLESIRAGIAELAVPRELPPPQRKSPSGLDPALIERGVELARQDRANAFDLARLVAEVKAEGGSAFDVFEVWFEVQGTGLKASDMRDPVVASEWEEFSRLLGIGERDAERTQSIRAHLATAEAATNDLLALAIPALAELRRRLLAAIEARDANALLAIRNEAGEWADKSVEVKVESEAALAHLLDGGPPWFVALAEPSAGEALAAVRREIDDAIAVLNIDASKG